MDGYPVDWFQAGRNDGRYGSKVIHVGVKFLFPTKDADKQYAKGYQEGRHEREQAEKQNPRR